MWCLSLLLPFIISPSGCLLLAGGAAAGGAAGYAYYRGNVTETYAADFLTVWNATHDAMYDLGMPVLNETHDAHGGVIESVTGTGEKVKITLKENLPPIPTDPTTTTVGVRVATFGDQEVSQRIHEQIALRASRQPTAVSGSAQPVQQATWQSVPSKAPVPK